MDSEILVWLISISGFLIAAIFGIVLGMTLSSRSGKVPQVESNDEELRSVRSELSQTEAQVLRLESSLSESEQRQKQIAEELEKTRREGGVGQTADHITQVQQRAQQAESEVQRLKSQLGESQKAQSQVIILQRDLDLERQRHETTQQELHQKQKALDDLSTDLLDAQSKLDNLFDEPSEVTVVSPASAPLQQELATAHEEIEKLRNQLDAQGQGVAAVPAAPDDQSALIHQLRRDLEQTRNELKSTQDRADYLDAKIEKDEEITSKQQIETVRTKELNKELRKLRAENDKLRADITKAEDDNRTIVDKLKKTQPGLAPPKAKEILAVQAELKSVERKAQTKEQILNKEIERLKSDNQKLRDSQKKKDRDQRKSQIDSDKAHEAEIKRLNKELQQLRDDSWGSPDQVEVKALEQELKQAKQELQNAEQELKSFRTTAQVSESRGDEIERLTRDNQQLRDAERELATLRSDMETLEDELKETRTKAQLAESRGEELSRVTEENRRLREDKRQTSGLDEELSAVQEELREALVRAQSAESRGAEIERLLEENRSLRQDIDELADLREGEAEFKKLVGDHQSLKLEHETMKRRVDELEEAKSEHAKLKHSHTLVEKEALEAEKLRKEVQFLQSQLIGLGQTPRKQEERQPAKETTELAQTGRIGEILAGLENSPGFRTAIVADHQGLLVGAIGDQEFQEEMAALSGVAETLAVRAGDMLPLVNVDRVHLHGQNELYFTCRFFAAGTDQFILTSLCGQTLPEGQTEDAIVEALSAAL